MTKDITAALAELEQTLAATEPQSRRAMVLAAVDLIDAAKVLRHLKLPRALVMPLITRIAPLVMTQHFDQLGTAALAFLGELRAEAERQGAAHVLEFAGSVERGA